MKITPLLRSNNLQGRPRTGCDAATKEEHLGVLCALQVQDQGGDDDYDYEDEDDGGDEGGGGDNSGILTCPPRWYLGALRTLFCKAGHGVRPSGNFGSDVFAQPILYISTAAAPLQEYGGPEGGGGEEEAERKGGEDDQACQDCEDGQIH